MGVALEGTPKVVMPPKLRRDAERLNDFVKSGKVSEADFPRLISEGLDASVVKYWKELFGNGDKETKEFVAELLKEHAKAELDNEKQVLKVKLARAYDLANEMVRKGMLTDDRNVISAYVENDILTWNDGAFESMKRVVNKTAMKKTAGITPQVGVNEGIHRAHVEESLQDQLDQAFSTVRYSRF